LRLRVLTLLATLVAAHPLAAQTLPLRNYTIDDGLAHDWVLRIRRDSRGLLWFATFSGLSRFDGSRFVSFHVEDGLPYPVINDVFEDRQGRLWIATNGGGVARLRPDTPRASSRGLKIESMRVGDSRSSNRINVIHQDASGQMWLGTDAGLFRSTDADRMQFTAAPLGLAEPDRLVGVFGLASAPNGDLWAGTTHGVIRRTSSGQHQLFVFSDGGSSRLTRAVLIDRDGLVWTGGNAGVIVMRPGTANTRVRRLTPAPCRMSNSGTVEEPDNPDAACRITTAHGLNADAIVSIHQMADGVMAIGTRNGLVTLGSTRAHALADLPGQDVEWTVPDGDTGFWLGTRSSGAFLAARSAFTPVGPSDDYKTPGEVQRLLLDRLGRIYAVGSNWTITRFDGLKTVTARPRLPSDLEPSFRTNSVLRDREGGWWIGSGRGLFRFAPAEAEQLASAAPIARYNNGNELPGDQITQLFEDSRGDIWIGVVAPSGEVLVRWNRTTGAFQRFPAEPGLPRFGFVMSAVEDKSKQLWFGFREGGLSRFSNGRFTFFGAAQGVDSPVRALHVDPAGRLWCGLYNGMLRVDDPGASTPTFVRYSRDQGLASGEVYSFASDRVGRLYIGYDQGLDRLDPQAGAITHFNQLDGIPAGVVNATLADGNGNVWVGTRRGLARMQPGPERIPPPPRVRIASVHAAGLDLAVSPLGELAVTIPRLRHGDEVLQVEFFGLTDRLGERLLFEYRLDDLDWHRPTPDRTVTYASLSAGRHRFEVRAVNLVGLRSPQSATVLFEVARPLWQRWWVLLLAGMTFSAVLYAGHRVRVASLVHVERVRARIATDLHDDIGASLSQISMLAEVARYRAPADEGVTGPLSGIASSSRTLVDNMADIVWAINPRRDSLNDLIHRMRRFASDTLAAAEIGLRFTAPETLKDRRLGADIRRQVLLILKESVTNIARHSSATQAEVALTVDTGTLSLRISDNGRGFDPARVEDGNGLDSMRKRVALLGGVLDILSSPGAGTTVTLKIDSVARRAWLATYIGSAGRGSFD
jgi:ligand-binding sensor domain-containing protein/signal transduction histidine kinase